MHYKMQKRSEECKKNVNVKDVITTLCKLLSALDVESVPTAEVFRKAKFNKTDAVSLPKFTKTLLLYTAHIIHVFNDQM